MVEVVGDLADGGAGRNSVVCGVFQVRGGGGTERGVRVWVMRGGQLWLDSGNETLMTTLVRCPPSTFGGGYSR